MVPGTARGCARAGRRRESPGRLSAALGRILCAPNAFKGSLSAEEVATAMALGARDAGVPAMARPVADGGDGTLDVLVAAAGDAARITHHRVTGPLGDSVQARIGWLQGGRTVVEMADAAGLRLLPPDRRNALRATSRGAGELVVAALEAGADEVVVGVGGSASSDGGAGLLQALGARLVDADSHELPAGGGALARLASIDGSGMRSLQGRVRVACDVRNPLLGPHGAAAVFGPQKGASPEEVKQLERGLERLAEVAVRDLGAAGLADAPGSGAAGGAGYGLLLLGATLVPGASLVCELAGVTPELIAGFDAVLTGEGRLDSQTPFGKAPAEVALRAAAAGVPAVAIAGTVDDPLPQLFRFAIGLDEMAEVHGGDTFAHAAALVRAAAREAVTRLFTDDGLGG